MGPPPFSDGNSRPPWRPPRGRTNLQWGHRLSAMETEALAMEWLMEYDLQWGHGHRLSAMETRPALFHRAPPDGPSMGPPPFSDGNADAGVQGVEHVLPSMGPPPFSDGNTGWIAHPTPPTRSFNGATAFQRWKLSQLRFDRISSRDLQWGHRLSAMETSTSAPTAGFRLGAFNGATAFQRWKHAGSLIVKSDRGTVLQWGHRLSAMETA